MRLWPAMCGVRIVRTASSFSLLLLLAGACLATDYAQIKQQLDTAKTPAQAEKVLTEHYPTGDESVDENIADLQDSTAEERVVAIRTLRQMVELRALATSPVPSAPIKAEATRIKSSPLYRDAGLKETSNWIEAAIRRLASLLPKFRKPDVNLPNAPSLPNWIIPLMWAVLGAAVLAFGYFAVRHFAWKRSARRKARAVLEEDEPDRTLDEWLTLADSLTAEGRYREAVRAVYLSCLLKFDEHNVARFVRGETNWEHLARIQSSARKPVGLDFLPPTRAFDRIWYGHHVRGIEDVEQFRAWYAGIKEALAGVRL